MPQMSNIFLRLYGASKCALSLLGNADNLTPATISSEYQHHQLNTCKPCYRTAHLLHGTMPSCQCYNDRNSNTGGED